jgi:hypothetical protein
MEVPQGVTLFLAFFFEARSEVAASPASRLTILDTHCQEGSVGPSHPSKCWHLVQLSPEAPCLPLAPQALTISITTTAKSENLEKKQW